MSTMYADGRKRNLEIPGALDSSEDLTATQEKRCRADDLYLALFADKDIVRELAQRWGPEMKADWDVNHATLAGVADAAISVWPADERNGAFGQQLSAEEEKLRGKWSVLPSDVDRLPGRSQSFLAGYGCRPAQGYWGHSLGDYVEKGGGRKGREGSPGG